MSIASKFLGLFLGFSSVLAAAEIANTPSPRSDLVPGIALSQGITEITGVAISPLLGVSSVGAWRYWKTPEAVRNSLPWYAQPWAWGTGFGLLALCFLKDSLGTAVPGLLKKPFDMVELFENKASALVASGAFVPLIAREMATHLQIERSISVPTGSIANLSFTMVDTTWLLVPAAVVAFLLVFVCSHAINVLIILSPFSTLDALLKLMRMGLLLGVGLIYFIAPWLAAVVCLGIIVVAAWLAPSAMRLAIFGARYAGDILLPWWGRARANPEQPHAFTLGRMSGLPPRTGGRVELREDGSAVFRYRRWCVLDECIIPLPDGSRHAEKGLFSPSLVHRAGEKNESKIFIFLPRYRGKEELLVKHLRLHGVREHSLVRGFAAVKEWIKAMFRKDEIHQIL